MDRPDREARTMLDRCEGCESQPFAGIRSHAAGRESPSKNIERCDLCERYGSDDVAQDMFDLLLWVQAVIDGAEPDEPNTPNVEAMAISFKPFTNG